MTRKVLGRGLDALLGGVSRPVPVAPEAGAPAEPAPAAGLIRLALDRIDPNPDQPRHNVDPASLEELAASIRAQGLLQPLLVTPGQAGRYTLIAGERRWQAARLAGLSEAPCLLREVTPTERLALALIENIQRQNLNAIEEATAYSRLIQDFGLTQEEVARYVGRDRTTVTNFVRLLKLPEAVQGDLLQGRLSMGHARALLGLEESPPKLLAARAKVLHKNLSVRQTETLVQRLRKGRPQAGPSRLQVQLKAEQESLARSLGTKVLISRRGKRGRIVIEFYSDDQLQGLLDRFMLVSNRS